jgi:hypothetical protein
VFGLEGHNQRFEGLYHEELLKDRVHVANTAEVSNTHEVVSGLGLLPDLYVPHRLQSAQK